MPPSGGLGYVSTRPAEGRVRLCNRGETMCSRQKLAIPNESHLTGQTTARSYTRIVPVFTGHIEVPYRLRFGCLAIEGPAFQGNSGWVHRTNI